MNRALNQFLARLAAGLCVLAGVSEAASAQGVIELRPTARLAPGTPLTLDAIADLTGPDAQRWSQLSLETSDQAEVSPDDAGEDQDKDDAGHAAPHSSRWKKVTIEDVRELLQKQHDVHWGRLVLRGSSCDVAWVVPQAAASTTPEPVPAPSDPAAGPLVRVLATGRIAQFLEVPVQDVRVEFADQDAKLLDIPTAGRVVEIQPIGKSDRMALSVRIYEGERILADGTIRARVQVRRDVLVSHEPLSRGQTLSRENTAIESRWIPATEQPADPQQAMGTVAKSKIRPGQMIVSQDVEPAVVVRKGDLVNVDCLSGSIVLRRTMRSTQSARDGETVTLQALVGKATARARMSGVGRAVMLLDGASTAASSPVLAANNPPDTATPSSEADASAAPASSDLSASEPATGGVQVGGIRINKRSDLTQAQRVDRYTVLANKRIGAERPAATHSKAAPTAAEQRGAGGSNR